MRSAAAVVLVLVTATGTLLVFLFDFDFLIFFGRALAFIAIDVPFNAVRRKFSGRRTACLRPSGCGSRMNRDEALGEAVGVNRDELWRDL